MADANHIYRVSTWHVCPDYRFEGLEIKVCERRDGFYASAPKLGCGKTCSSAHRAISQLLGDHACQLTKCELVHSQVF